MKNAKIADGFIDAFDTAETHRLQGGCGVVVFIFCRTMSACTTTSGGARRSRG